MNGRDGKDTTWLFRGAGIVIGFAIIMFLLNYMVELFWAGWR